MIPSNIVAIVAKTSSGEIFNIPISDFTTSNQEVTKKGSVPSSDGGKYIESGIEVQSDGTVILKSYKSTNSHAGTPVGLLGFDTNGNVITTPLIKQGAFESGNITEATSEFNGTPFTLPIYNELGDGLFSSDILTDGNGNYTVGGSLPFYGWDVFRKSINVTQAIDSSTQGYRINGQLVMTVERDIDGIVGSPTRVVIGNTTYNAIDADELILTGGKLNLVWGSNTDQGIYWLSNRDTTSVVGSIKPTTEGYSFFLDGMNTFSLGIEQPTADITGYIPTRSTSFTFATTDTSWQTVGNTLVATGKMGSISNHDVEFIRNNATQLSLLSTKVQSNVDFVTLGSMTIGTIAAESTDVDKFLVSNAGLVKYRTGTQLLSDIGAFATPTGLTTNYLPKWNGSALANSLVFDNGTNVGIGTTSPQSLFHLKKDNTTNNIIYPVSVSNNYHVENTIGNGVGIKLFLGGDGETTKWASIEAVSESVWNNDTGLAFRTQYQAGGGTERLRISSLGNIGIGTTAPEYRVHVNNGGVAVTGISSGLFVGNRDSNGYNFEWYAIGQNLNLYQHASDFDIISFNQNGNVGIGTTSPAYKLDVNGTSRTTNLKITNGATVGYVWQCNNADGSGVWTSPLTSERYIGEWAANSGSAPSGSPTTGDYWVVNTAGTYSGTTYTAGDEIYWNGTTWLKRSNYLTLPTATSSILGGIKIGSNLAIDGSGVVTVTSSPILTTSRNIAMTGDVAWNVDFNGSGNVTAAATLATVSDSGTGTFLKITRNTKGLVTGTQAVTTSDITSLLDAYTKTESDGLYVHLTGDEDVDGLKNFFQGAILSTLTVSTQEYAAGIGLFTDASELLSDNIVAVKAPKLVFYNTQLNSVFSDNGLLIGGTIHAGSNASEKLQVNGNIRYNTLLKPNNIAGTSGQFLGTSGTQDIWTTLTTSHISNLSAYTGFDARYFTETESDARFVALGGSYSNPSWLTSLAWSKLSGVPSSFTPSAHTLDSHSNVTITSNTSGELLKWNGTAWINNTPDEANLVDKSSTQSIGGNKSLTGVTVLGNGSTMTIDGSSPFGVTKTFTGIHSITNVSSASTSIHRFQVAGNDRFGVFNEGIRIGTVSLTVSNKPTERLQVDGNIRYNNLLRPNNIAGTNKQVLGTDGTQDAWVSLDASYISNFNLDNLTDVIITTPTNGDVLYYNGVNFVNSTLDNADIVTKSTSQTITGGKAFLGGISSNIITVGTDGITMNLFTVTETGGTKKSHISSGTGMLGEAVRPLAFYANNYLMKGGNLKLGGTAGFAGLTTLLANATERLDIDGNIRYSGTLKPNNIGGSAGKFLSNNGTNDTWNTILTSDVYNLETLLSGKQEVLNTGTGLIHSAGGTITYIDGTSGQVAAIDGSGNKNFMNLELKPIYLSHTRIPVGSYFDNYSETNTLSYEADRLLRVSSNAAQVSHISMGITANATDGILEYVGLGDMWLKSQKDIYIDNFKAGGDRFLKVTNTGKIYASTSGSSGGGSASLTANHIGFGDAGGILSGSSNFQWFDGRFIRIQDKTNSNRFMAIGYNIGSTESILTSESLSGSPLGMSIYSPTLKLSALSGSGTMMVVADSSGNLSRQSIPSGGGVPSLTSMQIGFGDGSNLMTSSANFEYDNTKTAIYLNDGGNYLYIGKSVASSDMYDIAAVGTRGITMNTDLDIVIKNSNHLYLGSGNDNKRVHIGRGASYNSTTHYLVINGEEFSFSMDNISGWGDTNSASTPQVGDKILFNVVDVGGNKRFVPQKINKKLASALSGTETVLIL